LGTVSTHACAPEFPNENRRVGAGEIIRFRSSSDWSSSVVSGAEVWDGCRGLLGLVCGSDVGNRGEPGKFEGCGNCGGVGPERAPVQLGEGHRVRFGLSGSRLANGSWKAPG